MVLELTEQRLKSAKDRVDKFIDQNIILWATEEMLLPGQGDILASGLPEAAGRALSLEKTGFMKFDLVWDYIVNGTKVHFFIELGTSPHTIRAKGKLFGGADALHWKGLSGGFVIGKDNFAKKVEHPGTRPRGLIATIKKERMPQLKSRIISETENRMEIEKL